MNYYRTIDSPWGTLLLTARESGLSGVYFASQQYFPASLDGEESTAGDGVLAMAEQQLDAYFQGRLRHFDLPLSPQGTPFQLQVWQEIARVPLGTTISYGELAQRVGRPSAARAAGAATGRNPLSLVVPCHRVIGAGGALTGYAGGLDRKRALLAFESRLAGGASQ